MQYTFKLTEQEANMVVDSLGERPYKMTAKLIGNLQLQFQKQQTEAKEPALEETALGKSTDK